MIMIMYARTCSLCSSSRLSTFSIVRLASGMDSRYSYEAPGATISPSSFSTASGLWGRKGRTMIKREI